MSYPTEADFEEAQTHPAPPRRRLPVAWQHCTVPPKVVCLCGSTGFMDQFFRRGGKETLRGRIVLSVGVVVPGRALRREGLVG